MCPGPRRLVDLLGKPVAGPLDRGDHPDASLANKENALRCYRFGYT